MILRAASTSDVIDAALTALGQPGDTVLTSDVGDFEHLIEASGSPHVHLVHV